MIAIKGCAYCGAEQDECHVGMSITTEGNYYYAECDACNARSGNADSPIGAIQHWNRIFEAVKESEK